MSCELLIFFCFVLFCFVLMEHLKALFSVSTVRFHRLYQSPASTLRWNLNYQKPDVLLMLSALADNQKSSKVVYSCQCF